MISRVRLALALVMLAGASPRDGAASPQRDCVMCGHVCCCPDACAAEKARRAQDCAAAARLCARPDAAPVARPHALLRDADAVRPALISAPLNASPPAAGGGLAPRRENLSGAPPALDVLTPPPRSKSPAL
jgi:hypothetical protein